MIYYKFHPSLLSRHPVISEFRSIRRCCKS